MTTRKTLKSRVRRTVKKTAEWSTAKKIGVAAAIVAVPVAAAALTRALVRRKKARAGSAGKPRRAAH